jgi:hypothetical protein
VFDEVVWFLENVEKDSISILEDEWKEEFVVSGVENLVESTTMSAPWVAG